MSASSYCALDLRGMLPAYAGGLASTTAVLDIRALVIRSLNRYVREARVPIGAKSLPLLCELSPNAFFWLDSPFDGSQQEIYGHRITYRSECPRCGSDEHRSCAVPLGQYRPRDLVAQWQRDALTSETRRMAAEHARAATFRMPPHMNVEPVDAAELNRWAIEHHEHIKAVRNGFGVLDFDAIRQIRAEWEREVTQRV